MTEADGSEQLAPELLLDSVVTVSRTDDCFIESITPQSRHSTVIIFNYSTKAKDTLQCRLSAAEFPSAEIPK